MKFFSASFSTIVVRFYLMMAVVVFAVLIGPLWLAAFALPLFLSALLGPTFGKSKGFVAQQRAQSSLISTRVQNLASQ